MLYDLVRAGLFRCDPEWSHDLAIKNLSRFASTPVDLLWRQCVPNIPTEVCGIQFKNPIGLAAGLDKNAECIDAFAAMGFGFIEVGTVTPRPQLGNDKPRMFRLPEANAIINRMGFNNKGVDYLVEQVKQSRFQGPLGINIGKNKDTPNEKGKDDYIHCLRKVFTHASYVTVNISSPNTPGLRDLQFGESLDDLLSAVRNEQLDLSAKHGKQVPIFVKIAPDMDEVGVSQVADALMKSEMDGVIATNTTLDRSMVEGMEHAQEQGGLSGAPVREKSTQVIRRLRELTEGRLPIIGVGGIDSAESATEKLDAGASLVQVYTGFIYQGPELVKTIAQVLKQQR
ncbi:quinone-dependent dihydroorotate dehydrogenase [Algicola sagamiensis]|uniref:quinone-dependent dihydroorotate dehydrogenase n=1 Tax=Algicola sagamiensis TaxID=163869 RepID=UPI0003769035|nr:quinone-dependent dihydroorotate dehydrogenase [Algicola sagamiensis]